jgi:hypothetical protein
LIWIEITNSVRGKARLYPELRQQGRYRYVPTYLAHVSHADGTNLYSFAVTRDSSAIVFGRQTTRYGSNGECPPSRVGRPYHAVIHDRNELFPFGLRLYEPEYRNRYHLRGEGCTVRSAVMFHHGPAMTEGCFTVAGGKTGFTEWRQVLEYLIAASTSTEIRVSVQPRPESHHAIHLTR